MLKALRPQPSTLLAAAALTLLLAACQKPPQAELDAARAAAAQADTGDGAKYAPTQLAEARQALQAAEAEVEAQNGKFALFRKYDRAKELIRHAESTAQAAGEAAASAKAEARSQARSALDGARQSLEGVRAQLTALGGCRRQPKGFRADLEALSARVAALDGELATAEQSFTAEDYQGAKAAADSIAERVAPLAADLTQAKARLHC